MSKLYLYNTLTRKKEIFKPRKDKRVGMYSCGPTVYNYAHLGNLRTYIFEDVLKRVLCYNGYKVIHVMNITDVGHLIGDRDMGEDKLESGAKREGKTARELANYYTKAFKNDLCRLNIIEPDIWCKATEHIKEQIALIKILEKRGYTYKISDGIYFDTSKVQRYNVLSRQNLKKLEEGARVEKNLEKRQPTDFALWKFSPTLVKRQMEWASPWGIGFPGWHIECSAMSMKYLGSQFDIHCGGIDHIDIHHTNEIAQSEAAIGKKPWVKYWLHGAFLKIAGGKKMAKSEGNFLTLENAFLIQGISPLIFRFAVLQVHYRKPMEFSRAAVNSAKLGLEHLYNQLRNLAPAIKYVYKLPLSKEEKQKIIDGIAEIEGRGGNLREKFGDTINDDLNMPQALAVLQEMLKSNLPDKEKLALALDFDKIFGLNFTDIIQGPPPPEKVKKLLDERQSARKNKNWERADKLRQEIKKLGYQVEDTGDGMRVRIK